MTVKAVERNNVMEQEIILTEDQQSVIDFAAKQDTHSMRVQGAAGTGKTLIAALIADEFALKTDLLGSNNTVGLITYTNTAKEELNRLTKNVTATTYHKFAKTFLRKNSIDLSYDVFSSNLNEFREEINDTGLNDNIICDEIDWIFTKGIKHYEDYSIGGKTIQGYGTCERTGRGENRFQKNSQIREKVWRVFERYNEFCADNNKVDFRDVGNYICGLSLNGELEPICTYLVVDEVQDFSENEIKSMSLMISNKKNLTLIGDLAQSIHQKLFSWKKTGISMSKGKSFLLTKNFRNSKEIACVAECLLKNEYRLKEHPLDEYTPMDIASEDDCGKPEVLFFDSDDEEIAHVSARIKELRDQYPEESICFLYRSKKTYSTARKISYLLRDIGYEAEYIKDHERTPGQKIFWTTMTNAKGLEFDNVFAVGINEKVMPELAEEDDGYNAKLNAERRLLFVTMTRAKKRLFLSSSGTPSILLAETNPFLVTIDSYSTADSTEAYRKQWMLLGERRKTTRTEFEKTNAKISGIEKEIEEISEQPDDSAISTDALLTEVQERKLRLEALLEKVEIELGKVEEYAQWLCGQQIDYGEALQDQGEVLEEEERPQFLFPDNAKMLILGETGIKDNDMHSVFKELKFNRDSWEHKKYEDLKKNYNAQNLIGSYLSYSDLFIGPVPHKIKGTEGENSLVEFLEKHRDDVPKFQVNKGNDGSLVRISKSKLKEMIRYSDKYAHMRNMN